jgi:hypothetical protein
MSNEGIGLDKLPSCEDRRLPMSDKQHAVELLDRLRPGQLAAVVHLLESVLAEDRDTLSDSERLAISEADEWLKHNQPIPHEEVLAEFGLTMADWEKMAAEPLPEETRRVKR